MAWFPIMIELGGRPCLVAGGGTTAQRKARSLLEAGALVKVVSLRFVAGFDSLDVRREARAVRPQDVQGMALVVDATGDPETARQLRQIRDALTTPYAQYSAKCKRCSLLEYCMPSVKRSADSYCEQLAQEAKEAEAL